MRALRGRAWLWRLGGWLVLGVGAAVVELALLGALHEALALPLWVASPAAAEALILARFLIADRWIFHHARPAPRRLARYHGACAGALAVYLVIFNGLTIPLGLPYVLAFLLGSGASFAWSLVSNFRWVWAQPAGGSAIPPRRPRPAGPRDGAGGPGAGPD